MPSQLGPFEASIALARLITISTTPYKERTTPMSESLPARPVRDPASEPPDAVEVLSCQQKKFAEALGHALAEQWLKSHSPGEQDVAEHRSSTDESASNRQ